VKYAVFISINEKMQAAINGVANLRSQGNVTVCPGDDSTKSVKKFHVSGGLAALKTGGQIRFCRTALM
jgi:hypothetical protein